MQPKISRPEDLVAYQTADELANLVDDITPRIERKDRDWCEQIRRSTAKAPAQIAEGFCRFLPRDGANYYRMARASLAETQSHLKRGLRRTHLTQDEFKKAWNLSEVALKTTTGLLTAKLAQVEKQKRAKQQAERSPRVNESSDPSSGRSAPCPTGSEATPPPPDRERSDPLPGP